MTAPGSRALDAPAMSAERRALEIAVGALREIKTESRDALAHSRMRYRADKTLDHIRALVPDAGGDGT